MPMRATTELEAARRRLQAQLNAATDRAYALVDGSRNGDAGRA